jgi:DNA adenine methylase
MSYPGGKAAVVHKLINLMPPHSTYVEAFLGGGAVMRSKQPAAYNIGVDLDAAVISGWSAGAVEMPRLASGVSDERRRRGARTPACSVHTHVNADPTPANPPMCDRYRFLRGDALTFLASYPFERDALIYCDPPYLLETLASGRQRYRHEFSDAQHSELLATIRGLPCRVMISGYWSELYGRTLQDWNAIHFEAMTRGGYTATEWVWFNFPEPVALHDYRFLGETFRERQDLKRQRERWIARLEAMSVLKKRMLLSAIAGLGADAERIR